ncbi:MAG: hypothetical protein ACOCRC_03285 [Halodesulfurarchaeum sp.]
MVNEVIYIHNSDNFTIQIPTYRLVPPLKRGVPLFFVTADDEQLSPTRSGQFIADDAEPAAAGGGGGGGSILGSTDTSGPSEDSGDRTEPEPTVESEEIAPETMPDLPVEAAERAWSAVPEPLRIGLQAIVLSGLGGLALFTVGRGVFQLLWP